MFVKIEFETYSGQAGDNQEGWHSYSSYKRAAFGTDNIFMRLFSIQTISLNIGETS